MMNFLLPLLHGDSPGSNHSSGPVELCSTHVVCRELVKAFLSLPVLTSQIESPSHHHVHKDPGERLRQPWAVLSAWILTLMQTELFLPDSHSGLVH